MTNPFRELHWDGQTYQPAAWLADTSVPRKFNTPASIDPSLQAGVVLAAPGANALPDKRCRWTDAPISGGGGVTIGPLFGARCGPAAGSTNYPADLLRVTNNFSSTGKLAIERIYTGTGTQFPGFCAIPNTTSMTTLVTNVADPTATINGSLDSQYLAFFAGLSKPCYFSPLIQEPDVGWNGQAGSQGKSGYTPALCKAAVDHVAALAADFPLVKVGIVLTSFQIKQWGAAAMSQWCSTLADWVGVDCYANAGIPALNTLVLALQKGQSLATLMGQPMMVPEMGYWTGVTGQGGLGYTSAQLAVMYPAAIDYIRQEKMLGCTIFESNKLPGGDGNWCIEIGIALVPTPSIQTAYTDAVDLSVAQLTAAGIL